MIINEISITNFKSFKEITVKLNEFNVILGANASGKSNFIQALKFIHDIVEYGLDNAISLQGGVDYLRNAKIGSTERLSINLKFDIKDEDQIRLLGPKPKDNQALLLYKLDYEFDLEFRVKGHGYKIINDKATLYYKCLEIIRQGKNSKKVKSHTETGDFKYTIYKDSRKIKTNIQKPDFFKFDEEDFFPKLLKNIFNQPKDLLLRNIFFFLPPSTDNYFNNICIYDFDPKLLKKPSSITSKNELEEDGSNLAFVLMKIINNRKNKKVFSNLINELLPFVNDVNVEKFVDKSILFKIKEEYSNNLFFPSSLMSDGTVNITALLVALYFEEKPLIVIEEPERNIHPYLLSKLVNMMKDASANKQIIITTHNPEVVKYTDLNSLYFISRCSDGYSTISKPYEKEGIRLFLKNEIGIDDLYVKNLLEV